MLPNMYLCQMNGTLCAPVTSIWGFVYPTSYQEWEKCVLPAECVKCVWSLNDGVSWSIWIGWLVLMSRHGDNNLQTTRSVSVVWDGMDSVRILYVFAFLVVMGHCGDGALVEWPPRLGNTKKTRSEPYNGFTRITHITEITYVWNVFLSLVYWFSNASHFA